MLKVDKLNIEVAGLTVCKDLNLRLRPGMCVGVLGLNGSGKTTLLHTLAGFLTPASGTVLLDNNSLHAMQAKLRAQKLGCLLQDREFNFPFSVFETAALARYSHLARFTLLSRNDNKKIQDALKLTGLYDKQSQDVRTLSGGEKQRLALASIIVQNPKIYLMDEPTNNLDLSYISLIRSIAQNDTKASIMVLHDLSLVDEICTHVLLLKSGRFLFGNKESVLNEDNLTWVYATTIKKIKADDRNFYICPDSAKL